jgi:hypothetical protein
MLLFLFDGVLLFRYAERRFWPLLFQLPPRYTRFVPEDAPMNHSIAEITGTRKQKMRRHRFRIEGEETSH